MLKLIAILLVLTSASLAQSSSDGSFSVHHSKHKKFSLGSAKMREAESLYRSACEVVQHEYGGSSGGLHPHFRVVIGAKRNEVEAVTSPNHQLEGMIEIRLKKWNPMVFAEGVIVVAFEEMLTIDMIQQLGSRAVRDSGAAADVAGYK
jgi:hypothetical protein